MTAFGPWLALAVGSGIVVAGACAWWLVPPTPARAGTEIVTGRPLKLLPALGFAVLLAAMALPCVAAIAPGPASQITG